jgi:hypothetical protein
MNVKEFWNDVLHQNCEKLPCYFDENAQIRWHCTNEQFTVSEYITVNCEYPDEWDGTIERIVETGKFIISVVKVFPKGGGHPCHVTSFAEIKNGKIISMDEYWADDGEAPLWRQKMNIGRPIISLGE